ncbi:hypothetical protein DRJ25_00530 [Candidatus Woesearchaeota archaeon]|nr:MAG: hypothetical protein DRJ25_00530 [Candidatus Woesearchaeota archaeon]
MRKFKSFRSVFSVSVLLALLLLSSFAVAKVYPDKKVTVAEKGPWKITHFDSRILPVRFQTFVYMQPTYLDPYKGTGRGGYPPFWPRATAYIRSSESAGYPRTTVTINTKDLPSSFENPVFFEVWLYDDDTEQALSLGVFYTSMGGSAKFEYNYKNYIGPYDRILITIEPFYDDDPGPGSVILEGRISKPFFFRPQPKQTRMITDVIKENII